jgi:hypothetical protein
MTAAVLDLLADATEAIWTGDHLPVSLVEAICVRVAALEGVDRASVMPAPAGLPTGPMHDESVTAAVITLAEQIVLDAHGVTDAHTSPVRDALGEPALVAVASAVALMRAHALIHHVGIDTSARR